MSTREFEAFEAGRRYRQHSIPVDLQEMQGDNLLRELVRITAQNELATERPERTDPPG